VGVAVAGPASRHLSNARRLDAFDADGKMQREAGLRKKERERRKWTQEFNVQDPVRTAGDCAR
jgi:hypothetical protein